MPKYPKNIPKISQQISQNDCLVLGADATAAEAPSTQCPTSFNITANLDLLVGSEAPELSVDFEFAANATNVIRGLWRLPSGDMHQFELGNWSAAGQDNDTRKFNGTFAQTGKTMTSTLILDSAVLTASDLGTYRFRVSVNNTLCPMSPTVTLTNALCPKNIIAANVTTSTDGRHTPILSAAFRTTPATNKTLLTGSWSKAGSRATFRGESYHSRANDSHLFRLAVTNATMPDLGKYRFELSVDGAVCPIKATVELRNGTDADFCPRSAIRSDGDRRIVIDPKAAPTTIMVEFDFDGADSSARIEWHLASGAVYQFGLGEWEQREKRAFNVTFLRSGDSPTVHTSMLILPNVTRMDLGLYRFRLLVNGVACNEKVVIKLSDRNGKSRGATVLGSVLVVLAMAVGAIAWV